MIQAHDIVLFDKHEIEGFTLPEWVVLTEKMFGTVRRASTDHAEILPIGLRGPARNQRWSTEISKHNEAIQDVRNTNDTMLTNRYTNETAKTFGRVETNKVRAKMDEEWDA